MKNINFNIDIPQDNPFQFDKLHRQPSVEMFTNIISGFPQGCVCSINAPWGMGKTQFVKMLQMKLNQDGHRTFFFNAWESDYSEDPITAIISEMSISKHNKNIWGLMGRLVIGVGKELGKGALHKISGLECDSVFDALADWSKKKVEDYENQKATIEQFKQLLSEEIALTSSKLPVIFFVDELDRCNPIFAVRTLERIKHIFDIPNIVFVLSIDKKQLENSICGYFGTDKFDAEEYLRRFIDIEYQLPEPSYDSYIDHIAHNVGIEQDLRMEGSLAYEDFKRILSFQVASEHLSLRQIEKLLIHVSIITSSFSTGALMEYIAFFVYLSFFKCEILNKIENKQYNDVAELLHDIQALCPKADDDYSFFIGKILGLYGDYIGCLDLKNPDTWLPKNNLYFSEDAAMQLIPGMKQIIKADYSHKIILEEILRHIHLYSHITKF